MIPFCTLFLNTEGTLGQDKEFYIRVLSRKNDGPSLVKGSQACGNSRQVGENLNFVNLCLDLVVFAAKIFLSVCSACA